MEPMPPPIIEITGLVLIPPGSTSPYGINRLTVDTGDVIAIAADTPADSRHLLRVLATLAQPEKGNYRFNGTTVNLKQYRQCLAVKRRIGYVAADSTMISNRTILENLLFTRFYYENDMTIDIDRTMGALCRDAGLFQNLNRRPSALSGGELLKAITIREMGKAPEVMLIDQPENFMATTTNNALFSHLKQMVRSGTAVVFISHNSEMSSLANRRLTLADGRIRLGSVSRFGSSKQVTI